MIAGLTSFWNDESGQDMVEYALLLAFISLVAVSLLASIRGSVTSLWTGVSTSLSKATIAAS